MEASEVTTTEVVDPNGQSTEVVAADAAAPVQASETPAQEQSTEIPTKFVGKSLDDVLKSYGELEREAGRLRNENGDFKRKLETRETSQVTPKSEPVASAPVKTIEEIYEEEWKEDPKQAVVNYNKRKEYQNNITTLARSQEEFYNEALSGTNATYADFKEYVPVMEEITAKFAPMLTPEARLSPQAIQLAYLVAKGLSVTQKLTEATNLTTQKATEIVKKREKAFSESSSTATSDTVDFSKLSSEERRKILGVADRSGD